MDAPSRWLSLRAVQKAMTPTPEALAQWADKALDHLLPLHSRQERIECLLADMQPILAEQTSEIERLKILWDVIEDMPETGGYPTLAQWESVIDAHEAARAAAQGGRNG